MSKSETDSQYHAVYLLDAPDVVVKKLKKAVTDSYGEIRFSTDADRAGVQNLLTIYQALTNQSTEAVEEAFVGKGYGHLKMAVAEAINETLAPLQARYRELTSDLSYLDSILADGAEKARAIADETVTTVKERMGFLLPQP